MDLVGWRRYDRPDGFRRGGFWMVNWELQVDPERVELRSWLSPGDLLFGGVLGAVGAALLPVAMAPALREQADLMDAALAAGVAAMLLGVAFLLFVRFQRTRCRVLLEAKGDLTWRRGGLFHLDEGALPPASFVSMKLAPSTYVVLVHAAGEIPLFACNELDAVPSLRRVTDAFRELVARRG